MKITLFDRPAENLAPDQFTFWLPSADSVVRIGPEQREVPLPEIPLPINNNQVDDPPTDNAIGQGVYDYLRRFPDCMHNRDYAELLKEAYQHLLSDLAAQAVMLDAKEVDPAFVLRKLVALKILHLLEPENVGLLRQLSRGYYEQALIFTELPHCRRHLLQAMRYALALNKLEPDDVSNLNLLAEIDMLFADYPSAANRWERMLKGVDDRELADTIGQRVAKCRAQEMPDRSQVDDLEDLAAAMELYASKNYTLAGAILDRLEENHEFLEEFPSAEFFYMLGTCRLKLDDRAGAIAALHNALEIDPEHELTRAALDDL